MQVLRSQRVLVDGKIQPADLIIEHDIIQSVLPHGATTGAFDLGNKLIVPGFIDLHSDSVEQEIEPRPGAEFPVKSALVLSLIHISEPTRQDTRSRMPSSA